MGEKLAIKKSEFSRFYPLFFTLVVVFILFQYSFSSLEAIFYDLRVKYDLGLSYKDNIVLITMDEESDRFLGENYPYTYASHERLMSRLSIDGKPKLVAYMVNLEEPITDTEASALERFRQRIIDFRVSGGGFRFGTDLGDGGETLPPRDLRDLGHSLAIINVDSLTFARDEVTRRAILNISGDSSIHLWAANFARAKKGKANLDSSVVRGAYYLPEADATFFMYRYFDNPLEGKSRIKRIPFHRVAVGNFPAGYFEDKIVIVGSRNIEKQSDFVLSAFNKEDYRTPKINIHAQILQSLLQNKSVYQLPQYITYALCLIISIFLSFIVSILRPTRGLIITAAVMVAVIIVSYLMFTIFGLWLYTTHLVLSVFVVYYIGVPFRAIGEHQRRYAIQEEAKLIKKVENLKQNFISLMSHDLKTPVAKIAGTADVMLQQNRSDKELSKGLNYIIESTKELNKFITSILDLTKIESRDITLNIASKDVNKLIESVVESLEPEAHKKGMRINTELSPLYPIEFDLDLIRRVITNLVENAIKYSGENTAITIKTKDDEKWVYITVEDNGAGISPADLEHVFDKFYRVKNDASHVIKGSGLGLYLVKYFVELHGGKISVESTLGVGTKFTVHLKNM
jgi:signal transduction histidine kinase